MKDLTFERRITEVTGKATKLMNMIHELKDGKDIKIEALDDMVFGILRDETELISLIESKEMKSQSQVIQLPIMNQKRGA